MSKLDEILKIEPGDHGSTVLKLIDVNRAKQAIQQWALDIVGENEEEFNTPKPELANMVRNRFREELGAKIKEGEDE